MAPPEKLGLRVVRKRRRPPLARAHFRVFIDDKEIGLASVSALHWGDEGCADPEIKQTVVLRRAVGADKTLYRWRRAVARGKDDERCVTIAQLDSPDGRPVNIWQLERAVAIRWTGPALDARSPDIAFEELEIHYESIAWRASA